MVYQTGQHLCERLITGQRVLTNCIIQRGYPCHKILQGTVKQIEGHFWILMSAETHTFPRAEPEMAGLFRIVDACAGIGAVAAGYDACKAQVLCHLEANPKFHQWLHSKTKVPCIRGDITDRRAVAEVAKHTPVSHTLSTGISCQPFSRLGDGKQGKDPRSASFPGALLMGYFLGSLAFLLDCTQEAMDSEWIQNQLMSFEKQIKHHVCQNVLHLHELWPAKRTRWWAIIAHPALAIQSIPRIPVLRLGPSIIHVIRNLLNMPADQLSQLEPTQYELRQFYFAKGGIGRSVIDMYRAMPTATHSWGS